MSNVAEQRLRLDGRDYSNNLKAIRNSSKTELSEINKSVQRSGSAFRDYGNLVKTQAAGLGQTLKKLGKEFADNLGRGTVLGGTAAMGSFMHTQLKQAAATGVDFERSLAQIASRADLSQDKVKKLRRELFELGKTGANLSSLPGAVQSIFGKTGNIDAAMDVANPIAKAAAMGNGDAEEVANFVKERLTGENKEINRGNVTELLHDLVLAQRGGDFANLGEAMEGFRSTDATALRRAGVSDREYAGILAGATRVGQSKETGLAAISALIKMSQTGFQGDAALAGILGVGSFRTHGKFDINKVLRGHTNLGENDFNRLAQAGGLSEQEANGLYALLKDADKFKEGMNKVAKDTKSFDQSFEETTDSVSHNLQRFRNSINKGFDEIIGPFDKFASDIFTGHFAKAAKALPGAVGESANGVMDNKALVLAGLGGTALTGFLAKKIFSGGGILGGVAKGKALEKAAGVTPVYVTNFDEVGGNASNKTISQGVDDFLKKTESIATGGGGFAGGAAGAAEGGSLLATAGTAAAGAGAVAAAYEAGNHIEDLAALPEKLVEALKTFFSKPQAAYTGPLPNGGLDVRVSVDSKDPGFRAKPKATDNMRHPQGQ